MINEEDAADTMMEYDDDVEPEVERDADDDSTYSILGLGDCNLHRHREMMRADIAEEGFIENEARSENDDYSSEDEEKDEQY